MVKLKRAYDPAMRGDGYRVLVERLWPRGIRKQNLALEEWMKAVAPSTALRKWFGHDPKRWPEFRQRYLKELKASPASEGLHALAERASTTTVTLIFSSHDAEHNNAVVLKQEIERLAIASSPSKRKHQKSPPLNVPSGESMSMRRALS